MDRYELVLMRLKAGLYQYEVAQLLSVPATIVSHLERGKDPITPEVEKRIREAINAAPPLSGKRAQISPFKEPTGGK